MKIEPELIETAYFLQPASFINMSIAEITAKNYKPYPRIMKEGGLIGYFNTQFKFVVNKELSFKYKDRFPVIAESMLKDTRDTDHKNFHLASLERGSLETYYEWELYQHIGLKKTSLIDAKRIRDAYGMLTLLVMRPELPVYDIIAPDGAKYFLDNLSLKNKEYTELPRSIKRDFWPGA